MIERELVLKVKADMSGVNRDIKGISQTIQQSTKGTAQQSKSANELNENFSKMHDTMQKIKSLDFAGLLIQGFKGSKEAIKENKKKVKELTQTIKRQRKEVKNLKKEWTETKEKISKIRTPKMKEFANKHFGDGKFEKSLSDTKSQIKALRLEKLHTIIKAVGAQLASIAATIGVIVAGMAMLAVNALKVSKATKQMTREAQKIGMSVSSYQKWGYVLESVGIEHDNMIDFIKGLSSEQMQAREGNEDTIKSFKKLGISMEELTTLDQQGLFEKTIKGLQNVQDEVERTALTYKIFGEEDAANLNNILQLNNQELEQLEKNYELLGGYSSKNLINSSVELAGATQNLSVAWTGLKNSLAQLIQPVIIPLVSWLVKLTACVRMFFNAIFELDTSKGMDKLSNSSSKVSGSLNQAQKTAEKLKRSIMGFDELNVMNDPNAGSSSTDIGGMAGAGGVGMSMDLPTPKDLGLDKWRKWFKGHKALIEDITTAVMTIGGLACVIAAFCTGNIPLGIAGAAAMGVGIAVGMGPDGTWMRLGKQFDVFSEDFKKKLKPFTQPIVDTWETVKNAGKECWPAIKETWEDLKPYVSILGEVVLANFKITIDFILLAVKNIIINLKLVISNIVNAIKTGVLIVLDVLALIINFVKTIFKIVSSVFDAIGALFRGDIKGFFKELKHIRVILGNFLGDIWDTIKKIFGRIGSYIVGVFKQSWAAIKGVFSNFGSFFSGLWDNLKGIFSKVGKTVGNAVGNAAKSSINWVLEKAINVINGFIKSINFSIGIINKIPGVDIKKIEKISIPKLATGGIATRSTIANVGEAGKEAILPLDRNTGWMDILANKLNGKSSKIYLMVNDRVLGECCVDSINNITNQQGQIPLTIV